jgi:cytidylate kinase
MNIIVAIDGPAGAGKSTVAKAVATALGYRLVDTGAIYRSVALLAGRQGVALDDDKALEVIVRGLDIDFAMVAGVNRVFLRGEDVTDAIRTPEVSRDASTVSTRRTVREGLLALQRRLAGHGGAVLEGRDIGTVVCPNAPVKIYLDADPEERTRRRVEELRAKGKDVTAEQVHEEMFARDAQDMGREHAPLKAAEDAIHLDSTKLTPEDVLKHIVDAVHKAGG